MKKILQFIVTPNKNGRLILFFLAFLPVVAPVNASEITSTTPISLIQTDRKVTLNVTEASLRTILLDIQQQAGTAFAISEEVYRDFPARTINLKEVTVEEALIALTRGSGYAYRLVNGQIVIEKAARVPSQPLTKVTVRGQVLSSATRQPLIGANVFVPGTTNGVATDTEGNFTIAAELTQPLSVQFLGMRPATRIVTPALATQMLLIELEEDAFTVEDVVVTGVFDRSQESYTAAVATFRQEDLVRVSNQNVITALGNLDASFQILENLEFGSDPNRLPDIQMRGASNFTDMKYKYQTSPNQPLFVLDGFETTLQKVLDLDMNRVASITLLKDATAKALYGSKGANGVVVIETVIPETGRMKVTYTGDVSVSIADLSSYKLTNAAEKLELEKRAGVYTSGSPATQQILDERYHELLNEVLRGVDTYWLKVPVRRGVDHKHSLYLEGGDQAFRYGIDFAYNKIAGVMKGSDREVISGGMNLQYRTGKFIFRDQLSVNFTKAHDSPYGTFSEYTKLNPYWRSHEPDGSVREILGTYNLANSQGTTPIYNPLINATLNTINRSSSMDITNNFYVEWLAFPGMRFKGRFGLLAARSDSERFLPRDHTEFRDITIDSEDYFKRGRYTMGNGKAFDYNADISANYSYFLNKHHLYANVQYSVSEKNSDFITFQAVGFANNKMDYIAQAKQYPETSSPSGAESVTREMSVVGSLNYSYDNRYLADATLRTNGSSLFGLDNRWELYWSAGVGWNLHNEKFLEAVPDVEKLRLRASTGYSGSQNFKTYQAYATYKYYNESYDNILGAYQLALANPNLKPQRTQDHNIGVDVSVLRRFDFSFDFYIKNTDLMLTPVTMPPSVGFSEYTENLGKVRNTGFESRINYRIIRNSSSQTYLGDIFQNKIDYLLIGKLVGDHRTDIPDVGNGQVTVGVSISPLVIGIQAEQVEMDIGPQGQRLAADNPVVFLAQYLFFEFRIVNQRVQIGYRLVQVDPYGVDIGPYRIVGVAVPAQVVGSGGRGGDVSAAAPFLCQQPYGTECKFPSV